MNIKKKLTPSSPSKNLFFFFFFFFLNFIIYENLPTITSFSYTHTCTHTTYPHTHLYRYSHLHPYTDIYAMPACVHHHIDMLALICITALKGKQQPMCYACQIKYTVKHILIECTDLAHIRKTLVQTIWRNCSKTLK